MENENVTEVTYPSPGKSLGFALGFLVVYLVIVFIVLNVFFRNPF